jgi:hypothetical protein
VDKAFLVEDKFKDIDEKKRKLYLQHRLRSTRPYLATPPEYQSPSINLFESTGQYQYQQSNDEVQHSNFQEPCLSPPTSTLMKANNPTSEECLW